MPFKNAIQKRIYEKKYRRKRRREKGIKEKILMPLAERIEHWRIASRKYYYSHLIQERLRTKRWKENNPEKQRFMEKRRKARKLNAKGSHTLEEWERIKRKYGNMCVYCQRTESEIKLTEDHIIPLNKGGSDYIGNIQPLCFNCNASKQDKIEEREETYFLRFCEEGELFNLIGIDYIEPEKREVKLNE